MLQAVKAAWQVRALSTLLALLACLLLPACAPARQPAPPRALVIEARPITSFLKDGSDRRQFGALEFRGGLVLTSRDSEFGGWSGLWRSADGAKLVAVSDRTHWLTATPTYADGRISGLAQAVIAPMLSAKGQALGDTRSYDTESLAIVGGIAFVGIERTHEIMRFDFGRDGVLARGHSIEVPKAVKSLPDNASLEAVGIAPPGSPIAGSLVAIAERSGGLDDPTAGWILDPQGLGLATGAFQVARSGYFDITDLNFLANGDMLVLERFYVPILGVKMRIRRIAAADIKPGALLDGPVLIEAEGAVAEIDNMEGLSIHRDAAGDTILTLISDDNFSSSQRTVLLEFKLERDADKREPVVRK